MNKGYYDYIALEKELRLLNDYQGQLIDREARLRVENDSMRAELDKKDEYIAQLEKALHRSNQ